jgi:hypothetical protein
VVLQFDRDTYAHRPESCNGSVGTRSTVGAAIVGKSTTGGDGWVAEQDAQVSIPKIQRTHTLYAEGSKARTETVWRKKESQRAGETEAKHDRADDANAGGHLMSVGPDGPQNTWIYEPPDCERD